MKKSFGLMNPIVVKSDAGMLTVKRAAKKVRVPFSEIKGVRTERRAIRGYCLVLDTQSETLYFPQTEGTVNKAMDYIRELVR